MANFSPLNNQVFFYVEKLIKEYKLEFPFLDIGCGVGALSKNLATKGWRGKAIEISEETIKKAKKNLLLFPQIKVEKKSFFNENSKFKTIFLCDVLEHLEDDNLALKKVSSLLLPKGYLFISIPSNPKEWRWDDDFYGHYRRYEIEEIKKKIIKVGLKPLVVYNYTFPFFWILRRIYTRLKPKPRIEINNKVDRTEKSAINDAWGVPLISYLMNKPSFIWNIMFKIQFRYYRNKLDKGYNLLILAKK